MAAEIVIACYRPKPGEQAQQTLESLVRRHHAALVERELVTQRAPMLMQASDGTWLEVFEWREGASAEAAHSDDVIGKLWQQMGEVADFVAPASIAGMDGRFPHFAPR